MCEHTSADSLPTQKQNLFPYLLFEAIPKYKTTATIIIDKT